MIGFLDRQGYAYGGALRPKQARLDLPDCLDTKHTKIDPRTARLFVLEFSPSANTDGLAHKGLELAEAVKQLCRFTGAKKVDIVAHSAGGLAARAYLQGALPGVEYRDDVDRLITIGTPHLGAAVASKVGDLLGMRATSLKPDAPLVEQLNQDLELPGDVRFASIVVRGFAADVRGVGKAYKKRVDRQFVARLPVDYHEGGDQLIHVLSQNLRLVPCAVSYEKASGRPIQYIVARVNDASWLPAGRRVHGAAANDGAVQDLVGRFLQKDSTLWIEQKLENRIDWLDDQARLYAIGVIEVEALDEHPASEVQKVALDRFERIGQKGDTWSYAFDATATSKGRVVSLRSHKTRVGGTLELEFDRFGRVVAAWARIKKREDL